MADPSGVCENTLSSSTSSIDVRSPSLVRTADPGGGWRVQRELAALVLGQRRPEADALAEHRDGVGLGDQPLALGAPGLAHHVVNHALQVVNVARDPLPLGRVGEPVDAQAQSGDRRPQLVGEVGDDLALALEQHLDPAGQPVQGGAELLHLGRPVHHELGGSRRVTELSGLGGEEKRIGWTNERPSRSASKDRAHEQHQPESGEDRPGEVDPRPGLRVEHVNPHHRCLLRDGAAPAERHRHQDLRRRPPRRRRGPGRSRVPRGPARPRPGWARSPGRPGRAPWSGCRRPGSPGRGRPTPAPLSCPDTTVSVACTSSAARESRSSSE